MNDSFKIISPLDQRVLAVRHYATLAEISRTAAQAARAAPGWQNTPLEMRARYAIQFVNCLRRMREPLAEQVTRQIGRPLTQADETARLLLNTENLAETARTALRPSHVHVGDGIERYVAPNPRGLVLSICAWNYPVAMASTAVVAPLLAGNVVIFKHAPQTALIGDYFATAAKDAGLPAGVFNVLDMTHADTASLIKSGLVDAIQFIGSYAGGCAVHAAANPWLIPTCLELGGKDPAYLRADADLDRAVPDLVEGCFGNAGQSCCSVERLYVNDSIYAEFIERFSEAAGKLRMSDPLYDPGDIGPVVSAESAARIRAVVSAAISRGALAILPEGRSRLPADGSAYVEPQILTNVDQKSDLMQQEVFGPVVGVMRVKTDEEAVALMNDSDYGLTAAIYTRDLPAGLALGERVKSGTLYLNRCDHADLHLTWGGVKRSGHGRSYGAQGFHDLVTWRSYHLRP